MNTYVNPVMLKWAREKSGYTIPDISLKLNKEEALIKKWEAGETTPSYAILEKLAYKYYKIPLILFYYPNPPEINTPRSKMRRLPDYEFARFSPDTYHKINIAQGYQASLMEIFGDKNDDNAIFKHIDGNEYSSIVDLAKDTRDFIGVSIKQQINFKNPETGLKAWRYYIESVGVFTFKDTFKDRFISGFSLLDSEYPVIFVNNSNSFTRQIFTIIHELAHILFGVTGVTDISTKYIGKLNDFDRNIEIKCNAFASELLLPDKYFAKEKVRTSQVDGNLITNLARKYTVSREVILRRLFDYDLLDSSTYRRYAREFLNDYIRYKSESSGGDYYLTKLSYLGEGFTKKAYQSYKSGIISDIELGQHLNMKAKNIANLQNYI